MEANATQTAVRVESGFFCGSKLGEKGRGSRRGLLKLHAGVSLADILNIYFKSFRGYF